MSANAAGWTLVALAVLSMLAGCPQAGLLLALGAGICGVMGSGGERADSRRRNTSRPWPDMAHREGGR